MSVPARRLVAPIDPVDRVALIDSVDGVALIDSVDGVPVRRRPLVLMAVMLMAVMLMVVALVVGSAIAPAQAQERTLAATGAVSGRICDAAAGIPGVTVAVLLAAYPVAIAQTTTDAGGAFRVDVAPGPYKLRFELPGGLVQFYPQRTDVALATVITVVEGQAVAVEEQVVAHGSLGGLITTSTGAVAAHAFVIMTGLDGIQIGSAEADDTGHYLLRYAPARTVNVLVGAARTSAPRQWAHQHKTHTGADPVVVTLGQTTTVDEQLLPLGTISGRFTGTSGPVSNVVVRANSLTNPAETIFAATGADGRFSLQAYPGPYQVQFQPGGSLDQWATGRESEALADTINLAANAHVVLDERALPTARVTGRLTDAAGQPAAGAAVVVEAANGEDEALNRSFLATTDADGGWFLTVRPGTYQVRFETSSQVQWARGRTSPGSADPITVAADQSVVVNDVLAVPGALAVKAVDARTGAAVTSFCADANTQFVYVHACTDDGTAEFDGLGAGTYTVKVSDGSHLDATLTGVRVNSGRATTATARLPRGATITVQVVDAVTGSPVSGICVDGLPADRAPRPGDFLGDCTDSTGTFVLSRVQPDRYVFFAGAFDDVHGSQWVGPHGGVGAQAAAKVVAARAGDLVNLVVKLDGRGAIGGVITDRTTGAPLADATIDVWGRAVASEADGHYLLDGLGPYDWVVSFSRDGYQTQWSGGTGTRFTATPIRVRVDRTTSYNAALRPARP